METIEELRGFLTTATQAGAWGQLTSRGTAWSLMRVNGVLPADAPPLGATIETDLAEHGFAVLRASLALRSREGSTPLSGQGFYRAATVFEAVARNANPEHKDLGFLRTLAAAAYHLAGYSAVAYSLFSEAPDNLNFAPGEVAIKLLILRDLDRLRTYIREWLAGEGVDDQAVAAALADADDADLDESLAIILNGAICRALAYFDFALQTGEADLIETARDLLATAGRIADNAGMVPLWWTIDLCRHLIDDLWEHSLHRTLPVDAPEGAAERYPELRDLFIGLLYARGTAEVELWPSQRDAARRSTDLTDDLVVSLPTSAGKTRVAEIAALMTLSTGRRVLLVTPLRALSAQTERSFRRTFAPLGFSVSSLYGASGVSSGDEDALRTREIIIATPEKLDFALRNDPGLIDDVGLIVLDEGHMIGPSEREIRFETLVQRLLRRADAAERRIVCLSAILPSGAELDDLTAWIRSDQPGDAVRTDWRPTRQRYGFLAWNGALAEARLTLDLNENVPFIDGFVTEKAAIKPDRKPYPRKAAQLALFAGWEFAAQGKRTLIFCTQANWVEGYGKQACKFVEKGYLESLLDDEPAIARALEVGTEWLGADHPAVASLKIGVAIHHGRLPSPFLRELEVLLAEGVLKVIVASPTLSQGLNLNAAVLLVPALVRAGETISGEEFANVAGRAGRAFVDVEGLIAHVAFDKVARRRGEWRRLVQSSKARTLKSGLIQIVAEILDRLGREGVLDREDAFEYLANAREAWRSENEEAEAPIALPEADGGGDVAVEDDDADDEGGAEEDDSIEEEPLSQLVERLDATVFGLIEALDADKADLPMLIDQALTGSLWARQIGREGEEVEKTHRLVLEARANLIWSATTPEARRGHFAMGVGLEAGLRIDAMAEELGALIDQADLASLPGDSDALAEALAALAERLLVMRPFIPDKRNALPGNWRALLKQWVSGTEVAEIGPHHMRVVEDAFMYRLVWALEAIRTRRVSLGWEPEIIAGGGAAALETGVPRLMMSMLIRAGLPSRRAAIAAIESTDPDFVTPAEMRAWLESNEIAALTDGGDWPTADTTELWKRFRAEALAGSSQKWTSGAFKRRLDVAEPPKPGPYRIVPNAQGDGRTWLMAPDFEPIAPFVKPISDQQPSLLAGTVVEGSRVVDAVRKGRGKARWARADDV